MQCLTLVCCQPTQLTIPSTQRAWVWHRLKSKNIPKQSFHLDASWLQSSFSALLVYHWHESLKPRKDKGYRKPQKWEKQSLKLHTVPIPGDLCLQTQTTQWALWLWCWEKFYLLWLLGSLLYRPLSVCPKHWLRNIYLVSSRSYDFKKLHKVGLKSLSFNFYPTPLLTYSYTLL